MFLIFTDSFDCLIKSHLKPRSTKAIATLKPMITKNGKIIPSTKKKAGQEATVGRIACTHIRVTAELCPAWHYCDFSLPEPLLSEQHGVVHSKGTAATFVGIQIR